MHGLDTSGKFIPMGWFSLDPMRGYKPQNLAPHTSQVNGPYNKRLKSHIADLRVLECFKAAVWASRQKLWCFHQISHFPKINKDWNSHFATFKSIYQYILTSVNKMCRARNGFVYIDSPQMWHVWRYSIGFEIHIRISSTFSLQPKHLDLTMVTGGDDSKINGVKCNCFKGIPSVKDLNIGAFNKMILNLENGWSMRYCC